MINRCAVCGYDLSENVVQYQKELALAEFERRSNTPENKAKQAAINKMLRSKSRKFNGLSLEGLLAILSIAFSIYCYVTNR